MYKDVCVRVCVRAYVCECYGSCDVVCFAEHKDKLHSTLDTFEKIDLCVRGELHNARTPRASGDISDSGDIIDVIVVTLTLR